MDGFWLFLAQIALTEAAIGIPTCFIYHRARGGRSIGTSYQRAILHQLKLVGWLAMVASCVVLVSIATDIMGLSRFGYPWWSIIFPPAVFLLGFGLRRLMLNLLGDDLLWNFNQPPR